MSLTIQQSVLKKPNEEAKYVTSEGEREKNVDAILRSSSTKKIVVGGPGTGKTYLFKRILGGKNNTLTLTFVNSLVEDLSLELFGITEVKTLHGYSRSLLKMVTNKNIKVFPQLNHIIKRDAEFLLNKMIDFDNLFHNRDDANVHLNFYKKRKDYYGYYGYSDMVFAAVKYLEYRNDKIPIFEQIVVDEFQDFNALEVSLIDLLAEKSPILLAGDDDQALYESLKSASPRHIRNRYADKRSGYASFSLPYCSRCTSVIVEAVNDIIAVATESGFLPNRICKPFMYFNDKNKDGVSDENPQLIYAQLFAKKIPWFIQKCIEEIAKENRDKFTVLILSPTKKQSQLIVDALKAKGFKNLQFFQKKETNVPSLLEGLKLLLENKKCNLGWRVVASRLLNDSELETLLKKTDESNPKNLIELISAELKKQVVKMLRTLKTVQKGKHPEDENGLACLLNKVGINPLSMARECLKDEIKFTAASDFNPGISKIPVTVTTIQSSKGLAADYVFISYFDDQYFIKEKDKNKVSDQDICNFLVGLTRARRKVFLISSDTNKTPCFLKWIDKKRILLYGTKDKTQEFC